MIRFEPIPEVASFLMSARMARFPYPEVADAVTLMERRTKTPSSDTEAWRAVYRDVLHVLIPQVLDAQHRLEEERKSVASGRSDRAGAMSPGAVQAAQTALQSEINHWQGRLQQQEAEILSKVEPALKGLDVVSAPDKTTGELVFLFQMDQLKRFWLWLAEVEARWSANNGKLASVRGNEAVAPLLPAGAFEVQPADLRPPLWQPPELHGERIPEPGFFQILGATYRTIMTSVTAVSGLGFFVSRTIPSSEVVARVIPIVSGVVFFAALAYASITIPKERRQGMARLRARAKGALQREVTAVAKTRLSAVATAHKSQIARHLTSESARLKKDLAASPGALELAFSPAAMSGGLTTADLGRLQGEWPTAIRRHLEELTV
jgi:hypothetical protein